MMGLRNNQQTINPREIADRSISIIGSIDSQDTFKHAVDLINSGTLGLERMITNQYSLNDFSTALKDLGCDLEKRQRSNDITSLKSVIQM
jgi:threonine dehydrogenase-like Zn-dependent dehydrogenase